MKRRIAKVEKHIEDYLEALDCKDKDIPIAEERSVEELQTKLERLCVVFLLVINRLETHALRLVIERLLTLMLQMTQTMETALWNLCRPYCATKTITLYRKIQNSEESKISALAKPGLPGTPGNGGAGGDPGVGGAEGSATGWCRPANRRGQSGRPGAQGPTQEATLAFR